MSRLLAEAEWAALTHAAIITWGSVAIIAVTCYGLIAVPGWIDSWRRAGQIIRDAQRETETAALDVTQPIPRPWTMDPSDCGCGTRERETLTCPKHAKQQLIDLEAMWQRREDAQ